MRRGRGAFHSDAEERERENGFRRSQTFPSHHHGTHAHSERETMPGENRYPPGLSQAVGDRLRELRTVSSSDGSGRDFGNVSGFGGAPPPQSYDHGWDDSGGKQNPGGGQYYSPQPSSGGYNSSPFPPPAPKPPFHPPMLPPGVPLMNPILFMGMSRGPPPPVRPGVGPIHMRANSPGVLPQANRGMPPPPPRLSDTGMARGPPANTGRPPAPQNHFRMAASLENVDARCSSYGPSTAPTHNAFLPPHPPAPLPSQLSSPHPAMSRKKSGDAFPRGHSGFSGSLPTSVSVSATSTGERWRESSCSDAQREVDMWLQKRGKGGWAADADHRMGRAEGTAGPPAPLSHTPHSSMEKPGGSITMGEAQNSLSNVLHALAAIQGELEQLQKQQGTADPQAWEASVTRLGQLKAAYLETREKLNVEQLKQLKRRLDLRRKKREREKRRRQEAREAEQQVQFERTQKHAAIDQWLEKLRQNDLNQQQMKRMKETADKTLGKVRRDIREARKMLDTVTRLQKLRAIRNDTAEKRGQLFPPSVAEHFREKTSDLMELLTQQLEAFLKEEAALKLILETENEEAKEKERAEKRQKEKERRQREVEEESLSLFGSQGAPGPGDPLQPFAQFYTQAQCSVHALVNIRREWDTFLVPDTIPLASRIPDSWVSAEVPSSAVWASVLHKRP